VELPIEVTDVAPELYSVVASANAEATFTIDVEATKRKLWTRRVLCSPRLTERTRL
jgi:hypothetical protein